MIALVESNDSEYEKNHKASICRESWTGCIHNQNKHGNPDLSPAIYTAHRMGEEGRDTIVDWISFRAYTVLTLKEYMFIFR